MVNTPNDQMSDLLLNLEYLMTSGADHLTGNLEHWELVYWSSSTNLRAQINKQITRAQNKSVPLAEITHTYLVIPKSDTFTSLLFETRQFLAACTHRGRPLSGDRKTKWWIKSHHLSDYQISVEEIGALQVGHPLTDIYTHAQQRVLRQTAFSGSQVVRETAILHELKHQAKERTLAAHAVELDKLVVWQLPAEDRNVQGSVINQHDRNELWTVFTS